MLNRYFYSKLLSQLHFEFEYVICNEYGKSIKHLLPEIKSFCQILSALPLPLPLPANTVLSLETWTATTTIAIAPGTFHVSLTTQPLQELESGKCHHFAPQNTVTVVVRVSRV